jgi:hypothetical protein
MNQARFGLFGTFLGFFCLQVFAFLEIRQHMWPQDLQTLLLKLLAVYSVPLSVILGGIFGQSRKPLTNPSPAVAWTAIVLAVLWNLLLVWRSISFTLASVDSVSDLVEYLDAIASAGTFLVAGALAFFFTKSAKAS